VPEINFHLVITTSFDQYAIQAIRSSAIDFLLKPVKASELKEAIERSRAKAIQDSGLVGIARKKKLMSRNSLPECIL